MKKQLEVSPLEFGSVGESKDLNNIGSNSYTALKYLIENAYCIQTLIFRPLDSAMYNYKEFCTIRMRSARRSGHTTAMCKVAYEYFNKVIFLCPTIGLANRLYNTFVSLYKNEDDIIQRTSGTIITKCGGYFFGSYESLDKFRGIDCEAVFIDPSCMLKPKKEEQIGY